MVMTPTKQPLSAFTMLLIAPETRWRSFALLAAFLCAVSSVTQAGLCNGRSSSSDYCPADCCEASSCDYDCVCESKLEPVKRRCWETKCEPVVVPAVTLPCCKCRLRKLFRRNRGDKGCASCGNGCCKNGFMSRLCSRFTKGRVRCVNTYKEKEYECGTQCVCEWKAVRRAGCGSGGCCELGSYCEAADCAPGGCQ